MSGVRRRLLLPAAVACAALVAAGAPAAAGVPAAAVPGVLATHLSIAPGSRTVHYRTVLDWRTRLADVIGPVTGVTVVLQVRPGGRGPWRTVRSATTDGSGAASAALRQTGSAQWRWYYGGSLTFASSASPTVTVRVLPPPRPRPATAAPDFGQRVVAEAARHNGAPYQYGAAGPDTFDCSGFTMYVFGRFGIGLPHNAQEQYDVVRHVPQRDIALGDLVFFYDSSGYVYHVGIYAGGGRMWDATHSGGTVTLEQIWTSAFWVGRV